VGKIAASLPWCEPPPLRVRWSKRVLSWSSIAAAIALPLWLAGLASMSSCGGGEFTVAAGDGAAADAVASAEGAAGGDAGGSATADFCQAVTAYYAHCQYTATCDQTNLRNCGAEGYALSDVARRAFIDCEANISCAHGADFVRESCVSGKLAATRPTAAQAKLASDYCAACAPDAGASCATLFFREGLTSAGDGPGFIALLYNDTLVGSMNKQCIPVPGSTGTCDLRFRICEYLVLQPPQVPADACKDGGP
jgi:hypothetical protein